MSIRFKVLAVLMFMLVLLAGLMHFVSNTVITNSYDNIEENEVGDRFIQLDQAIEMEGKGLASFLRDYTNWNDTYDYVLNNNQDYVNINFVDGTFNTLQVNDIIISGLDGTIFFNKTYYVKEGGQTETDHDLLAMLQFSGALLERVVHDKEWNGYLMSSGKTAWASSRLIYKSDGTGESFGMMTFVRWMDEDTIQRIGETTTFSIDLMRYYPNDLVQRLGSENVKVLNSTNMLLVKESDATSRQYILKKDLSGNPLLVFSSPYQRDINLQRIDTLGNYLLYFILMSSLIIVMIMILLESVVISRVIKFDEDVDKIGNGGGGGRRVKVNGRDEISTLAASINDMLRKVDETGADLFASEKRYKAIVQDQTELIFRIGRFGELTFANEAFMKYYGSVLDDIGSMRIVELVFEDDRQMLNDSLEVIRKDNNAICIELRCYDEEMRVRWQQWTVRRIGGDETDTLPEAQVVARDVSLQKQADEELVKYRNGLESMVKERTAELMLVNFTLQKEVEKRRQVEMELQESQKQYKAVVEDQTELIVRMKPDGSIGFANNAYRKYYGLDKQRAWEKVHMPNILDEDSSAFATFLNSMTIDDPVGMIEYRVNLCGQICWQQWTYRFIYGTSGELMEIQGVGRDITERKHLEEERGRSEHLESLGILAGGMAHEFNNMLTKVLGNITLAKELTLKTDPLRKKLESAERSIYDAKYLADSILTFSKGGEPIRKVISLPELIKEATGPVIERGKIDIDLHLPMDLWNVDADRSQLFQAINGIMMNAAESMSPGGTVKVVASNIEVQGNNGWKDLPPGRYIRLDVIDHGVGISKEDLPHIFDPYYSTKGKGGMGLPTVLSIVKRHSGTILVESTVDVGSKFSLIVPATEKELETTKQASSDFSMSGKKVLLMDDEEGILEVGSELLQEYGYSVSCAANGNEAVSIYRQAFEGGDPFDVVIMDLTIKGGMGGKDAIKKVLEIDPRARGIVSSGYSNDPVMAHPHEYGFVGVVKKPYMIGEMLQEIARVLENGHAKM